MGESEFFIKSYLWWIKYYSTRHSNTEWAVSLLCLRQLTDFIVS